MCVIQENIGMYCQYLFVSKNVNMCYVFLFIQQKYELKPRIYFQLTWFNVKSSVIVNTEIFHKASTHLGTWFVKSTSFFLKDLNLKLSQHLFCDNFNQK